MPGERGDAVVISEFDPGTGCAQAGVAASAALARMVGIIKRNAALDRDGVATLFGASDKVIFNI